MDSNVKYKQLLLHEPNALCAWCGARIEDDESFVRRTPNTILHINNASPDCDDMHQASLFEWST